uniref:Uncharacterized protein n=1 Tax=Oryza rufipogon TaxID=4529 RepID=A0A0E0QHS3_ORYRU
MQASVAVSEALEAGKLSAAPRDGAADFAVAWLAVVVVSLAVAATCVVVSFDAHARQPGRLRRMLDLGPSVRGARLLLAIFAGLLAAAEVIRLPFFSRAVVSPPRHVVPCLAYPLVPSPPAHVAVLVLPAAVAPYPGQLAHAADVDARCAYPAYAAALLVALAALYAPLLLSACWTVAAVAINRRMRARAYALAALVVVPLPVQVVALALSSVWETPRRTSPVAAFLGFLAVGIAAAAALAILVLLPVYDALFLGDDEQLPVAVAAAGEEARELDR